MTIEEFKKVDLRVGKVISAEKILNSEKLLKLSVDLGEEKRQVLAGVGKVYDPETLIGREIIIVTNLQPRMMMGFESQGMLLAATDAEGNPVILTTMNEVPPGAPIR